MTKKILLAFFSLLAFTTLYAASLNVPIYATVPQKEGLDKQIGYIIIQETSYGLLFTPHLKKLMPGLHGFHIHQVPSCDEQGHAAGGHFDPQKTDKHLGPYQKGHLGDLPPLYVESDGTATLPVLAPRLKTLKTLMGHSLMIHQGGDNYSDQPQKLGGGGARVACGVIRAR